MLHAKKKFALVYTVAVLIVLFFVGKFTFTRTMDWMYGPRYLTDIQIMKKYYHVAKSEGRPLSSYKEDIEKEVKRYFGSKETYSVVGLQRREAYWDSTGLKSYGDY